MFTEIVGIGLSPRERYGTSLFIQHELLSVSEGWGGKWNIKQSVSFSIADVFIRLRAFAHIFFFKLLNISQHEHLQPGLKCSCLPVRNNCQKKKKEEEKKKETPS